MASLLHLAGSPEKVINKLHLLAGSTVQRLQSHSRSIILVNGQVQLLRKVIKRTIHCLQPLVNLELGTQLVLNLFGALKEDGVPAMLLVHGMSVECLLRPAS